MINLERRRFLQTASVLVAGGYGTLALAEGTSPAPAFADKPAFDPAVLFLTWQRDPTTTMTVQWIGSAEDGAKRPIWHSKAGSLQWQQTLATGRPFPMSKYQIFR